MSAMNIYCSTTENLLYQLGGNDLWIPIVNNQTVKSSISMNVDTITLAGKNAVFNSSPLLTRNNFILQGIPDFALSSTGSLASGQLVPDNYAGNLFSVRLLLYGSDGFVEWLLYSWDITLIFRPQHPDYPDQNCEKKVDYFSSNAQMEIRGFPYMFYQEGPDELFGWVNPRYVCIYNSPITLSP
jgi:hypothetical protein